MNNKLLPFKIFLPIIVLLSVSGCQSLRIEKRMHRKGYTIFWNKRLPGSAVTSEKSAFKSADSIYSTPTKRNPEKQVLGEDTISEGLVTLIQPSETLFHSDEPSRLKVSERKKEKVQPKKHKKYSVNKRTSTSTLTTKIDQKSTLLFLTLSTLVMIPLIVNDSRRRKWQRWAAKHVHQARATIGLLTIVSAGISYFLGGFFSEITPEGMLPMTFIGIGGFSVLHLLSKKKRVKTNALIGMNLASSASMFVVGAVQKPANPDPYILSDWAIVLLLFLIIILMLAATIGLALLSCHIECSTGQATLAAIVWYGGFALIVFFGTWAIFNLFKRESQRDKSFAKYGFLGLLIAVVVAGIVTLINN